MTTSRNASSRRVCSAILAALALVAAPRSVGAQTPTPRVALLVPIAADTPWRELAFLSGVPAASAAGSGEPIVLAVDPDRPWRPELLDFLSRYEPDRIWWLGDAAPPAGGPARPVEAIACGSAEEAACALAAMAWTSSRRAVLFGIEDRAAAMAGAVLAARLRVPLLPCGDSAPSDAVRARLQDLGVEQVLSVGVAPGWRPDGIRVERLAGPEDVVRWLAKHGHRVDYLAATNPNDARSPHARSLSLAAVLLAAGRDGAVAPLPYDTRWKAETPGGQPLDAAPPGAHASRAGWRTGTTPGGDAARAFVTGIDPSDGHGWVQVDRDGDGAFDGAGEGSLRTGDVVSVGDSEWTVDLDVDEKTRGESVWWTAPTTARMQVDLARFRRAAGTDPTYLCLVGWPDTLPMAIIGDAQGIDADLVSDLPFGQTDDDPFVELAIGRVVAEDAAAGTLLACRSLARDDFRARSWERTFATAEWETACQDAFEAAGLRLAGHHDGAAMIDASSPLTDVGLIVHGSHAMWTVLGKTYAWDSDVLLAPCVVASSGCSTASLDQDPAHRSVAARMLRNGAVAFVGNTRRGVAQQELFLSEYENALLAGQTLGEANRSAQDRVIAAVLEKGELTRGLYHYQLYNSALFGDPALSPGLPEPPLPPARVTLRGLHATVRAPSTFWRAEYTPVAEWGCPFPKLYTWRAAGLGAESTWFPPERRNQDALFFTAEVHTRRRITGIEPLGDVPPGLGWTGRFFVDEHADGSRSVLWRVRLIDFDMTSGEVRAQADRLEFRLLTR